jgi:hypothetical protein
MRGISKRLQFLISEGFSAAMGMLDKDVLCNKTGLFEFDKTERANTSSSSSTHL